MTQQMTRHTTQQMTDHMTDPMTRQMTNTAEPAHTTIGDPRPLLAHAIDVARATIAEVRPEQMSLPTPCDEFDVRTMLAHSVAVLGRIAAVGEHLDALSVPSFVTDVADDGWIAAYDAAARRLDEVWQDGALLDDEFVLPWATMSGVDLLLTYVNEVAVHAWDLAVATGRSQTWDDEVLRTVRVHMLDALPASRRRTGFQAVRDQLPAHLRDIEPPFDDVVPVAEDAPEIDRLVAWNGRRPDWTCGA